MCPDKKLSWFNLNPDWREEHRVEVRKLVEQRWTESYMGEAGIEDISHSQRATGNKSGVCLRFFTVIMKTDNFLLALQMGSTEGNPSPIHLCA